MNCSCPNSSNGRVWVIKKCNPNLKVPWKRAHQELRNEAPLDMSVWLSQNPFMASLWIRSGLSWPERDFEVVIQTYQVGARFEALDELVFMAPSDLRCIFFYHPNPSIWAMCKWLLGVFISQASFKQLFRKTIYAVFFCQRMFFFG